MTEARSLDDDQPTLDRPAEAITGPKRRFTPGTLLGGRFRVISPLGRGGMGEVYRADDLKLGQPIALKFVRSDLPGAARERLYAEVRLGRQVSHPNVCRLYDIVEVDALTFIAMEYVDGEDLASLLSRIGHLAPDKALDVARDLCAGLQAAHERGVLHRDIKPANVMIDGRGRARITDFGLAAEQQDRPGADRAGTALYMSPEQLAGGEVSVRSDVYSLGLVFYEMVAGRRFFDAGSLDELRSQHRTDRLQRLGALSGLDRAFEQVIARCLEEDAERRPASVRALLASLPGGDPLEAAIAAGETPAPEVVAAAGTAGDLRPAVAWAALIGFLGMLAVAVPLLDRATMIPRTPPPKRGEVLVERAGSVLSALGHTASPRDWTAWYELDYRRFEHVSGRDRSPDRFDRVRGSPLSPLRFHYRQSPGSLVAANRHGAVVRGDPPADVPGMAEVDLDPQGRLTSYLGVPPAVEAGGPWPEPDWSTLFREAELDPALFRSVPPEHAAPVDSDRKAAWEGSYPGVPDFTVRLEAAAYHGRPVWFTLLPPWEKSPSARREAVGSSPYGPVLGATLAVVLPLGGLLLVRRNLRLGRGDRKGSLRIAFFSFATYSLGRLCNADHVASFGDEFWLLIKVFAYPLAFAALLWIFYMALEPYARRQWPHILISWGRLLSGRWRDPMVGRDLLLGAAAGALLRVILGFAVSLPSWLGGPQGATWGLANPQSLSSWKVVPHALFVNLHSATLWSVVNLFVLVLLRVVLRRRALALAAWSVLTAISGFQMDLSDPMDVIVTSTSFVLVVSVFILVMARGLLGYSSMLFVMFMTVPVHLTFDASVWWAPRGWVVLAALVTLGVYGFHTALAGKPAFGRDWLET
ncbi:MAG TPA: serine/threonine-protein kinase [Vicinamibacteria bacterium]|nr:serine/threonine-protein kinase [Vicinamibacteria bacterium]